MLTFRMKDKDVSKHWLAKGPKILEHLDPATFLKRMLCSVLSRQKHKSCKDREQEAKAMMSRGSVTQK